MIASISIASRDGGDAFAFLDPVFSSGVMLALKSGVLAGEEIHRGLGHGPAPVRVIAGLGQIGAQALAIRWRQAIHQPTHRRAQGVQEGNDLEAEARALIRFLIRAITPRK